MTLTILGSCSGTEPIEGRHHSSFVIEHDDRLFWFDAGESCSYTAHVQGLDVSTTEAVFITHTHMDHIGGLPNLLWTMRKLTSRSPEWKENLRGRTIPVYMPSLEVWTSMLTILSHTEGGFTANFDLNGQDYEDGVVYDKHGIRVTAQHNLHLGEPRDGEPWRSFSFRIEVDGKVVVYSGDVRGIEDLGSLIDGCDLLLMETGHHAVEDICSYLIREAKVFGKLVFTHHGRAILGDPERELKKAQKRLGDRVLVAHDSLRLEL